MTGQFVEGFVKRAIDLGCNDQTIAILFKVAVDSGVGGMFKNIQPATPQAANPNILALKQLLTNPRSEPLLGELLGQFQTQVPQQI